MKKILFRADAKPSIGTGDLVSLIYLSKAFKKNAWEIFFAVRDYEAGKNVLLQHQIKPDLLIPQAVSVEEEINAINEFCLSHKITHFFACITQWSLAKYAALDANLKKGCINNDGIVPSNWDLIVNWNFPDKNKYPRENFPKTRFLTGLEYVTLPESFNNEIIGRRVFNRPIKRLLITIGGADVHNLTTEIVNKLLEESINDLHVTLVLGAGFRGHEALNTALKSAGFSYECKVAVENMFPEYLNCDAAIGAGGLTAFELVATHTPSLLVAVVDHQVKRCQYLAEHGMAVFLGDKQEFRAKALGPQLARLAAFDNSNFSLSFRGVNAIHETFSTL